MQLLRIIGALVLALFANVSAHVATKTAAPPVVLGSPTPNSASIPYIDPVSKTKLLQDNEYHGRKYMNSIDSVSKTAFRSTNDDRNVIKRDDDTRCKYYTVFKLLTLLKSLTDIKECEHPHSQGQCFMHEVLSEGGCITPQYSRQQKTWIPDQGVICHMCDNVDCEVEWSYVSFFTYPGTADTGNDPIFKGALMEDARSAWCWIYKFGDVVPPTAAHWYAVPHTFHWQEHAPGEMPAGMEYDNWDERPKDITTTHH
jgi:hypothetical protein